MKPIFGMCSLLVLSACAGPSVVMSKAKAATSQTRSDEVSSAHRLSSENDRHPGSISASRHIASPATPGSLTSWAR